MIEAVLNPDQRQRVREILSSRGVGLQCSACNRNVLAVAANIGLLPSIEGMNEGLAVAHLICELCGYMQLHLLAALDPQIEGEIRAAYYAARGIMRPQP